MTINLAISTDEQYFGYNATLIASILRRTSLPVHVRCWVRGGLPEAFNTGPLKVEFISMDDEGMSKFHSQPGSADYFRLRVFLDCPDWDRCLVMTHDLLALCDLWPLFELDLGDHLLAKRRELPELLNLKAMRETGIWDTSTAAHSAVSSAQQLSLVAALNEQCLPLAAKWNLCAKADITNDKVPEAVIQWSGWPKPWHRNAKVWRPDIWLSEEASWEHLRMGIWEKPLAIVVEPENGRGIKGLLGRGWRVEVCCGGRNGMSAAEMAEAMELPDFPDFAIHDGGPTEFQELLRRTDCSPDLVKLGAFIESSEWLNGAVALPAYLVLAGELLPEEMMGVCALGYKDAHTIKTLEWPAGGPLPRVLDYCSVDFSQGLEAGHEIYWRRDLSFPKATGERPFIESRRAQLRVSEPKRIGVLVTVDSARLVQLASWLRSVRRNFLPGHDVSVILFTDGEYEDTSDLRVINIATSHEPELTRYSWFAEHSDDLQGYDYLYHLDLNTRVQVAVGEEIFGNLVGVEHPWYFDKTRRDFLYETRKESSACVEPDEGERYFYVRLQGGNPNAFLQASKVIAERIETDRARGITARWKDEAHWNRYLIDHPPSVVLSPAYCCFPDGCNGAFDPKIVIDEKSKRKQPKVTAIMATYGRHYCSERSIRMFLEQDYQNKHLLVLQNSPVFQRLAKEYNNITLVNKTGFDCMGDIFEEALNHIPSDTEFVCIWDDDDIYFRNHLSNGVRGITKCGKMGYKPKRSLFKKGDVVSAVSNTFEGSWILKLELLKKTGFNKLTFSNPHKLWVNYCIENNQGFFDPDSPFTYCYSWNNPEAPVYHVSGREKNPDNRELHHRSSTDHGDGIITPISLDALDRLYLGFDEHLIK